MLSFSLHPPFSLSLSINLSLFLLSLSLPLPLFSLPCSPQFLLRQEVKFSIEHLEWEVLTVAVEGENLLLRVAIATLEKSSLHSLCHLITSVFTASHSREGYLEAVSESVWRGGDKCAHVHTYIVHVCTGTCTCNMK